MAQLSTSPEKTAPTPPAWWKRYGLPRIFSQKIRHVPAYSKVAYFYDHLMRHVNYPRWARYVIDLFALTGERAVASVLELACGTGKTLVELAKTGYNVFGVDYSFYMAQQAAEALAPFAKNRVWRGDMQTLAVTEPVDAVICLYDSFNYCLEPKTARQTLDRVAHAVRRGGLFIFDICTERNCRRNFLNYYERDDYLEFSYVRRASFKPYRKMQINEFYITNEVAGGPGMYERHAQRIYSLREIEAMIDPEKWVMTGCFDGMSRRPGTEKSDRVHFVLKRL
ncbi:MAG: class I SAM-dependent DNA methyltransferase [bacterium]